MSMASRNLLPPASSPVVIRPADLVTEQPAGKGAGEDLHHQRQARAFMLAHGQNQPRGEDGRAGRVVGLPSCIQSPARRRLLALPQVGADLAYRGLAHRDIEHDRIEPRPPGRGNGQRIVAKDGRVESHPTMLGMALVVQMPIIPARAAWVAYECARPKCDTRVATQRPIP